MKTKKILIYFIVVIIIVVWQFPVLALEKQVKLICDPSSLKPVYYGQKGTAVENVQACLIQAGYDIPLNAIGYYGVQTRNAVKKFYSEWYGSWDGNYLNPQGIENLKNILTKISSEKPKPTVSIEILTQVIVLLTQGKINEALKLLSQSGKQQIVLSNLPTSSILLKNQDEEIIKSLLQQEMNIYSKGLEKITNDDLKTLYELYTPNYRTYVSFPEFKNYMETFLYVCSFYEPGEPLTINVKRLFNWFYEYDPSFSEIKNKMSFPQLWNSIRLIYPQLKEKMTLNELAGIISKDQSFKMDTIYLIMLCKGAKINVEDVKIKINEFPEGKWAKITYKFKISGQEITKLNITEEDPGIFREINNKWYLVEKNQNAPGFNLIDLPPDMRKLLLDQINNKRKYF